MLRATDEGRKYVLWLVLLPAAPIPVRLTEQHMCTIWLGAAPGMQSDLCTLLGSSSGTRCDPLLYPTFFSPGKTSSLEGGAFRVPLSYSSMRAVCPRIFSDRLPAASLHSRALRSDFCL